MKYPREASPLEPFEPFDLTKKVHPGKVIKDLKPLFGIANGIEDVENPYHAADKALKNSKRFGVSNLLCEIDADIQGKTISDLRFKGLEHRVAMAVEKQPNVRVGCCTQDCQETAIANSHTLQRGGTLKQLSGSSGKVYQTKLTPFTVGKALKELSIKSASTFPGFCETCEVSKFAASENAGASLTSELVCPLLWRAMCFIYFRRAQEVKLRGLMISKPQLFDILREHGDPATALSLALAFKNSIYAYRAAKKWKETFDRSMGRSSQPFRLISIELPSLPFVGAGMIPIPIAFDGSTDPNLFKFYKEISSLAYSTVLIGRTLHLVFAFRKSDPRAITFCSQMMNLNSEILLAYLPQIVIGGSDTVYISKDYWDDQATETDQLIITHAQMMKFPEMRFSQLGRLSGMKIGERRLLN